MLDFFRKFISRLKSNFNLTAFFIKYSYRLVVRKLSNLIGTQHYEWGNFASPTHKELANLAQQMIHTLPPVIGLSIAITKPKYKPFIFTFGEANLDRHYPMTSNTRLAIASLSKPLIMVLTLMIIEENPSQFPQEIHTPLTEIKDIKQKFIFSADGKVIMPDNSYVDLKKSTYHQSLSEPPIKSNKNNQAVNLDQINLHHLLLESSGFMDILSEVNLTNTPYISDFCQEVFDKILSPNTSLDSDNIQTSLQALKKYGLYKKANPEPIKPTQSHNTDALLLAVILERVTGKTLNELLYQKILKPLKLKPDSIHFKADAHAYDKSIARRYAFLSTDLEIEQAISAKQLCKAIDEELAYRLSANNLEKIGRKISFFNYQKQKVEYSRPVLDILNLNSQGFDSLPGAVGVIAQPKAYIRFYQALGAGKLLSQKQQKWFRDSFIEVPELNTENYHTAIGYGSNLRRKWSTSSKQPTFMMHTGFIIGGQSIALYDYGSDTTIMIAVNFTGNWNEMPCFQVAHASHMDYSAISGFAEAYAKLLRLI